MDDRYLSIWLKRQKSVHAHSYFQFIQTYSQECRIGNMIQSNQVIQVIEHLFAINLDLKGVHDRFKDIKDPCLKSFEDITSRDPDFSKWSTELQRLLALLLYRKL